MSLLISTGGGIKNSLLNFECLIFLADMKIRSNKMTITLLRGPLLKRDDFITLKVPQNAKLSHGTKK